MGPPGSPSPLRAPKAHGELEVWVGEARLRLQGQSPRHRRRHSRRQVSECKQGRVSRDPPRHSHTFVTWRRNAPHRAAGTWPLLAADIGLADPDPDPGDSPAECRNRPPGTGAGVTRSPGAWR